MKTLDDLIPPATRCIDLLARLFWALTPDTGVGPHVG